MPYNLLDLFPLFPFNCLFVPHLYDHPDDLWTDLPTVALAPSPCCHGALSETWVWRHVTEEKPWRLLIATGLSSDFLAWSRSRPCLVSSSASHHFPPPHLWGSLLHTCSLSVHGPTPVVFPLALGQFLFFLRTQLWLSLLHPHVSTSSFSLSPMLLPLHVPAVPFLCPLPTTWAPWD